MQGTGDYEPALDFQPPVSPQAAAMEAPAQPQDDAAIKRIEDALLQVLKHNTNEAIGMQQHRKRRWLMYMMMEQGKPPLDDPNDPLIQMGYFVPVLAKFADILIALIMQMLFPDDEWFQLDAKPSWPGLEQLAEAVTNLLRDKFKQMTPHMASGFMGVIRLMLRDLIVNGNWTALVTHEMISDPLEADNQDGLVEGPAVQRLPPGNVFPWRDDVNSFSETFTAIYDPLTPDQAHQMNFANAQALFETESTKKLRSLYMANSLSSFQSYNLVDEWRSPGVDMYERWVGLGQFPFYQVRRVLSEQEKDVVFEPDFDALIGALALKFQFDPMQVKPSTLFDLEWVGDTLVKCKPYELSLPHGKGPIFHFGLYPRGNYIWADGIYDRCQWDARFFNDLQRAVLTIVKFTAKGVFTANKDMLDQTWYQMHGSQIKFSPGDVIELDTKMGDTRKFFEKAETNEAAIPLIREQMTEQLGSIRMITGVYEDVEGQSSAGTATQASNNLQQGMVIIKTLCKFISGALEELVARNYVVMQQAARTIGHDQPVALSSEDNVLGQVMMEPNDIISLNCFEIKIIGVDSPGNKMNLIDKLISIFQMYLPTGGLEIKESLRYLLMMAGAGNWADRLAFTGNPQDMQAMIQNLQTVAGPGWMHYLPPAMQQQMGMMLGQGPQGGPGGPPGAGGPPQIGGPGQYSSDGQSATNNTSGAGRGYNTAPGQPPQMAQGNGAAPPMFAGRNG